MCVFTYVRALHVNIEAAAMSPFEHGQVFILHYHDEVRRGKARGILHII